ncbi:MAG: ferredoxin [Acidobacteria bacterium]|nr:ferredoxin [Acidobacteriota bacterium]
MLYLENNASEKASVEERYPDNVPGPFYCDTQCLDCDVCRDTAPYNFTRNDDGGYSYVYKQPTTIEELLACTEAMEACGVVAVGNDGGPVGDWFTPNDLILFYELQNSPTLQTFLNYVAQGGDLNTAFRLAAQYGTVETINALLDMGADINHQSPLDGSTALMFAVRGRDLEMVDCLINRNADVHWCNSKGETVMDQFEQSKKLPDLKAKLLAVGAIPTQK